jgi:hypothetical protein
MVDYHTIAELVSQIPVNTWNLLQENRIPVGGSSRNGPASVAEARRSREYGSAGHGSSPHSARRSSISAAPKSIPGIDCN